MSVTGHKRGNRITYDEAAQCWRYDDGEPATTERPCVKCHRSAGPDEPDPCLGWLPGVRAACCGHGVGAGYVMSENGEKR